MKKIFLMVMGLACWVLGQAQSAAPIVVERIYTSIGPATAALDSPSSASPLQAQFYRVSLQLAQPTYVHSLSFPNKSSSSGNLIVTLDGKFILEAGGRKNEISRVIQTIEILCFFNDKRKPLEGYRDGSMVRIVHPVYQELLKWQPLRFLDSTGTPHPVQFPHALPGRVLASSVEEPATRYHPTFLFDGRDDFGWGTDHGQDGAGESFALSLDAPLIVSRLKVWNGQQGSDSAFRRHPRVRTLLLSNGTDAPQRIALPDQAGPVTIELPQPLASATFQFSVESVYPGKASDVLVISELQLGHGNEWFTLAPDRDAQHNSFVRAKTKGTTLGALLDTFLLGFRVPADGRSRAMEAWMVHFGSDGSFYFLHSHQHKKPEFLEYTGGWEHFLPEDGVSRVKVWGYRRAIDEHRLGAAPSVPSEATYFEADVAIDAFQIQSNALSDAIPTQLRSDDLVSCTQYVPVKEELVYRTEKNFMGRVLYSPCTPCLLRDTTARALARAQAALDARAPGRGLTFRIWDAYRPYVVQKAMWDHTPDTNYVANPYTGGSSHNKGLAIDLTLVDASGNVLDMGTEFDDFSKKAHHGYKRLPKDVLANRALLKAAMEAAGFVALPTEWWHYRLPLDLPIVDLKFPCPY